MKKFAILLTFLTVLNTNLIAQKTPIQNNEENTESEKNKTIKKIQYYFGNPHQHTSGFSVYKQNYILPFTRSNKEGEQLYKNEIFSREHYEVKFQLSAKQQLFKINNFGLYIAYSQKSFWQAYYLEDSRPFRESNYNPELFLKYFFRKNLAIDFRGEHESNGGREPLSRSWNRIYIWPHFHSKNISINYKLWYRIPEKERKSPDDPEGDENPDIHKYLGYSKLGINFDFHNCQIAKTSHCNFKHKKVGFQLDLSIPTFLTSACLQFQYWGGYGESLIDYNVFQHKIGLDLILSR